MFFFFFSSRRRHTRLQGDWSSDVCSSDLNWSILLKHRKLTSFEFFPNDWSHASSEDFDGSYHLLMGQSRDPHLERNARKAQYLGDCPRRVDNPSFVCRIVASTEKMYGHIWLVANNPTIMARCYVEDVTGFHFDHASIV